MILPLAELKLSASLNDDSVCDRLEHAWQRAAKVDNVRTRFQWFQHYVISIRRGWKDELLWCR